MDKSRLHDLIRASRTDRRAFNRHLASLGLAAVAVPLVPNMARSAGEITYFTWAGYEIPELHPAYIEKYGGSPDMAFFADEEAALAKLRQGFAVDVAHPCNVVVQRWYESDVIKKIDPSRLEYWDDLIPALRDVPGTAVDGQPIFVANDWGSHSIAYRSDIIDPAYAEEKSWELLLDETLAGRIAMEGNLNSVVAFAAMILGIRDTTNVTDEQIEQMKEVLLRQKALLRSYFYVETNGEAMMSSGEVVASYFWSGPVYRLRDGGLPVEYMMNPKGGIISWSCGLVMTTSGQGDEQAAYDFINAWNSPEAGKFLIEVYGYGHSNTLTYDIVDPEILKSMGLDGDVAEYLSTSLPWQSWSPDLLMRYVRMQEEVQLAY